MQDRLSGQPNLYWFIAIVMSCFASTRRKEKKGKGKHQIGNHFDWLDNHQLHYLRDQTDSFRKHGLQARQQCLEEYPDINT